MVPLVYSPQGWDQSSLELHLAVLSRIGELEMCPHDCNVWQAAPRYGGEISRNPLVDAGDAPVDIPASPGNHPFEWFQFGVCLVGKWSRVKCLLDVWALNKNWRSVEKLEDIELALHEIWYCIVGLSSCRVARTVGR